MKEKEEKGIDVKNWEEFLKELENLREERCQIESSTGRHPSELLFRGHENSCWPLTTTLERPPYEREGMPFADYYRLISRVRPQIESFTETTWDITVDPEIARLLKEYDTLNLSMFPATAYSYMVYLRHHGFPSPLLDWTLSPYIAAFFAFRSVFKESGNVAIYVYCEKPEACKVSSNKPRIQHVGPYLRTHRRHFLQQCEYTLCVAFEFEKEWRFAPHKEVYARGRHDQDVLQKFNIPSTERRKVLKLLDGDYNINAYSLFGSEESLMETLALRELDFKEHDF